jgi:dihydrofolate reductase
MRRIHMFDRVSVDGYFGAPDGDLDWVIQDEALERETMANRGNHDAMMFGRKTYEGFKSFWPNAVDASPTSPSPHGPPRRNEALKAMGEFINRSTKYVFSRTLKDTSWAGTQLLGDFDPQKVEDLKHGAGGDILIFGSGSIASLLTQHGLIDEYTFIVSPILIGSGQRAIRDVTARMKLALEEVKQYPTGNLKVRYTKA